MSRASWGDSSSMPIPKSPNTVLLADSVVCVTQPEWRCDTLRSYLIRLDVVAPFREWRLDSVHVQGVGRLDRYVPGRIIASEAMVPAVTIQRASWPDR
jgi:hypothetical protein